CPPRPWSGSWRIPISRARNSPWGGGRCSSRSFPPNPSPNPAPRITTTSLPGGQTGASYSQTVAVSSGAPPYSLSVTAGSLPAGLSLNSSSGVISGTPGVGGSFSFTITATDRASAVASQAYTLAISSTSSLSITTASPLPGGTVGVAYSQTLAASGGTPSYSWSVTAGTLPGGLSLSSGGALTGRPTSAGTFTFTVQVSDSKSATANKQFSVTVIANASSLTITTTSPLPGGAIGVAYSQTLAASGGTPPYAWSIASGALPSGLALSAVSGAISGSPTSLGSFSFTARVTDSSTASADQPLSITIAASPPPATMSLTGVPATAASAQQVTFDLTLSSGFPRVITGQITLTFQPDAAVPKDDPAIQFSIGGRTANFTIPANTTHAVFAANPMAFQTGTVAGTLTLAVISDLPGSNFNRSIAVARAAPVIQSASVVTSSSGFQVRVAGFSNSRELVSATFHFTAASGQIIQTTDLSVNLSDLAGQWFSASNSAQFGGQVLLVVPFTVQQGSSSGLSSVSVQLKNGQSDSAAATANF
ncbi:MAG: Ig domain-containing protein, partial [Acidobacteriia bacterium]|nr:Ig domain-containing protein [Terriglobia bacterium]